MVSAECEAGGTQMKEQPGILHDEGQHGIRPIIVDGMQRGGWGYHYQPGREVAAGSIDVHVHAVPGDHQRDGRRVVAMCALMRSEEHTSELQSLMRISYAVFCLKKKQK